MARKQNRRKASPAAVILTVLVLAALFVWRMLGSPEDGKTQITLPNGELHVWFLDVGQADSSLLVCDGQAMLIDGGNVDDASYVVASLEQYGVTSLDYVINTHCDEDHVGGLAGVLAKFPAEHVWSSTAEYGTKAFSNFVKYANEQGRAIEIHPPETHLRSARRRSPCSARCATMKTTMKIPLSCASTTARQASSSPETWASLAEDELVESGARLDATVLKVGLTAAPDRRAMSSCARSCRTTPSSPSARTTPTATRPRQRSAVCGTRTHRSSAPDLQGVIHAVSDGRSVTFETERSATEAQLNPTIHDAAETYIGNVNSQIFHVSTCHSCPSEKNAVRFASVWDAMAQGYRAHSCVD